MKNVYRVDMYILNTTETATIFTLLKVVAHFNSEYPALRFSTTRNWATSECKTHATIEFTKLHKALFSQ